MVSCVSAERGLASAILHRRSSAFSAATDVVSAEFHERLANCAR